MIDRSLYVVLFIVRSILFAVVLHKYGWRAAGLAWLYAVATAVSPGSEVLA